MHTARALPPYTMCMYIFIALPFYQYTGTSILATLLTINSKWLMSGKRLVRVKEIPQDVISRLMDQGLLTCKVNHSTRPQRFTLDKL